MRAATFLLFTALATASPIPSNELAFAGGTFTDGSGATQVSITLDSFTQTIPMGADTFYNVGTVNLPLEADGELWDVGTMGLQFGALSETDDLYSLVLPWSPAGCLDFSLQLEGFDLGGVSEEVLELRFVPVVDLPGETDSLTLQTNIVAMIPEPRTEALMFLGFLAIGVALRYRAFHR